MSSIKYISTTSLRFFIFSWQKNKKLFTSLFHRFLVSFWQYGISYPWLPSPWEQTERKADVLLFIEAQVFAIVVCAIVNRSLYTLGKNSEIEFLEENSWVWKIWTEEEWEVEVKIWTTLTYHKVEWGYRSESEKIVLSKVNEVVVEKWSLMTHG